MSRLNHRTWPSGHGLVSLESFVPSQPCSDCEQRHLCEKDSDGDSHGLKPSLLSFSFSSPGGQKKAGLLALSIQDCALCDLRRKSGKPRAFNDQLLLQAPNLSSTERHALPHSHRTVALGSWSHCASQTPLPHNGLRLGGYCLLQGTS